MSKKSENKFEEILQLIGENARALNALAAEADAIISEVEKTLNEARVRIIADIIVPEGKHTNEFAIQWSYTRSGNWTIVASAAAYYDTPLKDLPTYYRIEAAAYMEDFLESINRELKDEIRLSKEKKA